MKQIYSWWHKNKRKKFQMILKHCNLTSLMGYILCAKISLKNYKLFLVIILLFVM